MSKLTNSKTSFVYTCYVGDYVTRIVVEGQNIYQCPGIDLDLEGLILLLKLKYDGFKIEIDGE